MAAAPSHANALYHVVLDNLNFAMTLANSKFLSSSL